MKIKEGANIQGLDIRMRSALIAADRIWKICGQELVITCGLDGEHSAGSLHYYGLAVDCRTRYFNQTDKKKVVIDLMDKIGHNFDIITHKTHIHIEYDKAKYEHI